MPGLGQKLVAHQLLRVCRTRSLVCSWGRLEIHDLQVPNTLLTATHGA
jgi:hypothetical protein